MGSRWDTVKYRFWEKVSLPDENGCMLWTGQTLKSGYGIFSIGGKKTTANRALLLIIEGIPLSEDLHSAHECRNKNCVAPSHLKWKTPKENAADRTCDNTENIGERNGQAVLRESQVVQIRKLAAQGVKQRGLATQFNVSYQHISSIVLRKTWRSSSLDEPVEDMLGSVLTSQQAERTADYA